MVALQNPQTQFVVVSSMFHHAEQKYLSKVLSREYGVVLYETPSRSFLHLPIREAREVYGQLKNGDSFEELLEKVKIGYEVVKVA